MRKLKPSSTYSSSRTVLLLVPLVRADGHPMLAQTAEAPREPGIRREEHPALAGGQQLARMKESAGELAAADWPAAGRSSRSRRRRPRSRRRRAGRTRPRSRRRRPACPAWWTTMTARGRGAEGASTVRREFGVWRSTSAKTGRRPDVARRVGGRDERQRRHHDLVPAADAEGGRARCSAVVHESSHGVRRADGAANTEASKAATRGPCAIQPEARPGHGQPLLVPSQGRMIGITPCDRDLPRSARHHVHEAAQPLLQRDSGRGSRAGSAAREVSAIRRAHVVDLARGAVRGSKWSASITSSSARDESEAGPRRRSRR